MTNEPILKLDNISKSFDGTSALRSINLTIRKNEFVTLLGPSGCGKTTTLRIIGGFEEADQGDLFFEDKNINHLPAYKRKVNTVFQRYALFPHMDVFDNIAFGLKIKKLSKLAIEEKVMYMLKLVDLETFGKRSVKTLSGGQQQRVAIARALVNEPEILLLDEPLGALDLKLRKGMQLELKNIQQKLGITFVYVTHDQEEALTMSDTIVVMNKGLIQQIGTPQDIYNEPENAFVANFIGESNIVDGIMHNDYKVTFLGRLFDCVDKGFTENESVDVVIRPEDIKITKAEDGMIRGRVKSTTFKGVHYEMMIEGVVAGDAEMMVHSTLMAEKGAIVGLGIDPFNIHIMKKGLVE
ncbi:MAG TPA: spermidine/putrescine ABC transporter ATP-binding protein [Bacillota bacterium]|nr:spermidine/putrescine ABC transporter ATP-binding protein [Bacillota bacterium]